MEPVLGSFGVRGQTFARRQFRGDGAEFARAIGRNLDQAGALGDFRHDIEKLARELGTRPEEGDKLQPEGTDQ